MGRDLSAAACDVDGRGDRGRPASGFKKAQGPPELPGLLLSLPDALRARSRRALLDLSPEQLRWPDPAAPARPAAAPAAAGALRRSGLAEAPADMITAPMADVVESLSRVPLFSGIGREKLAKLSDRMAERSFSEGKAATEEGKGGAACWTRAFGRPPSPR